MRCTISLLLGLVWTACGAMGAYGQEFPFMTRYDHVQPADGVPDAVMGAATPCDGGAAGAYACSHVDLMAFMPLGAFGSGTANDIWGWTDALTGHEYALIGLNDGTGFVDITDPENPVYLGKLPTHTTSSAWRDVKTYVDHAYIVSEAAGHGVQVFDLTQLRVVSNPPATFSETAHYNQVARAHNIAVNEATGFAYAVGSGGGGTTCAGGLHMIDIRDPANPTFAGCFSGDGYTHDVQCVVYQGPDAAHQGQEICLASNEDTVTIVDVTDKANPVQLSRTGYPTASYVHQGWLTEDHRYFYQNDEADTGNTRTMIWDVTDLDAPIQQAIFTNTTVSRDHNLYIVGDLMYQANYTTGLRVLDISDRLRPVQVGFFDTYAPNDGSAFQGAWSNYPFFDSGLVVVSSFGEGLFILRPDVASVAALAGRTLYYHTAQPVGGVQLDLTQGASQTTTSAADGAFSFVVLPGDYTLTPSLGADDPANRSLSTADLLAIRRHVLTADLLDTPYQIIAADVNRSNTVTTLDIVLIRQVILTTATGFPGGLWRFVSSDYVFPDPSNPLAQPFDEARSYTGLAETLTNQDFVAIKQGDVDASWTPPAGAPKDEPVAGVVRLRVDEPVQAPGEGVVVAIRAAAFEEVAAYQFTLAWDARVLAYERVERFGLPGMSSDHFGVHRVEEGILTTAWDDAAAEGRTLPDGSALFAVRFRVRDAGDGAVRITPEATAMAAYRGGDLARLVLEAEQGTATGVAPPDAVPAAFALAQNYPNPFNPSTEIAYALPAPEHVRLRVYDALGRAVATLVSGVQEAGRHRVTFDARTLPSGVYYYRLEAGAFTASKRMVLLR